MKSAGLLLFCLLISACTVIKDDIANTDGSAPESKTIESALSAVSLAAKGSEAVAWSSDNCIWGNYSSCTSSMNTFFWSSCSVLNLIRTGTWHETRSAGSCPNGAYPVALGDGESVTRTTNGDSLILTNKAQIITSTEAHTTYDGTLIPATGMTISKAAGVRTISIDGLQMVMYAPLKTLWFQHTIVANGITAVGTGPGGDREVNGSLTLYNNLAKFKATVTFTGVTWQRTDCCYPSTGTITSNLSGSRTGTETMDFDLTCGQATFTDRFGVSSTVTLSECN